MIILLIIAGFHGLRIIKYTYSLISVLTIIGALVVIVEVVMRIVVVVGVPPEGITMVLEIALMAPLVVNVVYLQQHWSQTMPLDQGWIAAEKPAFINR